MLEPTIPPRPRSLSELPSTNMRLEGVTEGPDDGPSAAYLVLLVGVFVGFLIAAGIAILLSR